MPLVIRMSRPHGRFQITDRNGTQYEPYYLTGSDSRRPEVRVTLDSGRVVGLPASRLSAFAQLPEDEMIDEDHPFVDHFNRDITDQSSTNLEGVDGSLNVQRSHDLNLGRKSHAPNQARRVQYNVLGDVALHTLSSVSDASRLFGQPMSAIWRACKDSSKTITDKTGRQLQLAYAPRPQSLPGEQWRTHSPVVGFSVEVSNRGRFVSNRGVLYTPTIVFGMRYAQVKIGGWSFIFHVLVAEVWQVEGYGDPEKSDVDHLTGNRNDNSAANLEYVTKSENKRRADALGLISSNSSKASLPIQGKYIDDQHGIGWMPFASATEAAELLGPGFSRPHISQVVNGKRKSTGKMIFERVFDQGLHGEEWMDIHIDGDTLTTAANQYNGLEEDRSMTLWELMPFLDPSGGDRRCNANKRAHEDDSDDDGDD